MDRATLIKFEIAVLRERKPCHVEGLPDDPNARILSHDIADAIEELQEQHTALQLVARAAAPLEEIMERYFGKDSTHVWNYKGYREYAEAIFPTCAAIREAMARAVAVGAVEDGGKHE